MIVTTHADTAELYAFALEHAGFAVRCVPTPDEAVPACLDTPPMAVVIHVSPRVNAEAIGTALRRASPSTALIGLFSMQLPMTSLKTVLDAFDDVVMIPCSPDALVARLGRLLERKRRQASA